MSSVDRYVFVSYCHADATWLARLRVHVRPLVRRNSLDIWDDSRIQPGQSWRDEIAGALVRAHVAVLLVSADFLASDFVANNELPPLLHRAAHAGLLVVPLVISPCLFLEHEELSRYQCANNPDRPLSTVPQADAEAALVSFARGLDQYFRRLESSVPRLSSQATPAPSRAQQPTAADVARRPPHRTDSANGSEAVDSIPLVVNRPFNLSFDGAVSDGVPAGWFNSFGHVSNVSTDYDIRVVRRSEIRTDGTCAVLEQRTTPTLRQFGSLMQRCRGRFLAGRAIRLEGELRTEEVSGWAGLWLRADAEAHPNLFFDNMSRRPVAGTTDWTRCFIDAPVPSNTDWLNYGIVLSGPGTLYADNLRLLVWHPDGRWEDV